MDVLSVVQLVFTVLSFLFVLSYYVLLFVPRQASRREHHFSSVSFIVPVHNEEAYIAQAIASIKAASFHGTKQIIVIDDGSSDGSFSLLRKMEGIILLQTAHLGKAAALNKGLSVATGEVIAIVDGDSYVRPDALHHLVRVLEEKNVAAACCPVRVRNRKGLFTMWLHLSEIYYSLLRSLFAKLNANITTPGPLSVYRRDVLVALGGFSEEGFAEDADIAVRLIRRGYRVGFSEQAIAETNMPHTLRWIWWQRTRFARGLVNLLRRHMRFGKGFVDVYVFPLMLFGYLQGLIMGLITVYQMISGYLVYFYGQGVVFSIDVALFFFNWLSLFGFFSWALDVAVGSAPLTILSGIAIVSSLLTYPLYILAFLRYDKKIDLWHVLPFLFLTPFWLFLMAAQFASLQDYFHSRQRNIWKKNE